VRRLGTLNWLWLGLGGLYFAVPLFATAISSTETSRHGHSLSAYGDVFRDPGFRHSLIFSGKLALAAIVVSTLLIAPTAYWVHLKLPRLRPVMEFFTILPLVVPPIVLVVGLLAAFPGDTYPAWFFDGSAPVLFDIPPILAGAYVILAFPYVYRSIDAGLRAIDIHTLTEAAQSLGASWPRTMWTIILPNIRPAVLNGAFLTLAIVLGEFTMAQLLSFNSFAVYIAGIGQAHATEAAALAIIAFALTWAVMLSLLVFTRGPGRARAAAQVGGTR